MQTPTIQCRYPCVWLLQEWGEENVVGIFEKNFYLSWLKITSICVG